MRYINIRQFTRNITEEIRNLPITVTRYGKPVVVITDANQSTGWVEPLAGEVGQPGSATSPTKSSINLKGLV